MQIYLHSTKIKNEKNWNTNHRSKQSSKRKPIFCSRSDMSCKENYFVISKGARHFLTAFYWYPYFVLRSVTQ